MRKVLIAALALTPMLLHAQAISPAKNQSSATAPVLQSKLAQPEAIVASAGSDSDATPSVRISTGVTAPKLISTVDVISVPNSFFGAIPVNKTVVVSLIVDQNGKPSDLKIVKSAGTQLDENVLDAVGQYRFRPGTLDNAPTAVPVNLEITVQHNGR